MQIFKVALVTTLLLVGCDKVPAQLSPAPQFELREFVVTEEKTDATDYSKAYNSFKGTGTLIARNVSGDRNLFVLLEARDKTAGTDSEPAMAPVLFRGGIGKVELTKSKYGEMSVRPDYQWSVLGWVELNKAAITLAGSQSK